MDANESVNELSGTSSNSSSQFINRTASTSEDKAAQRRARDAERKRRRRAADPDSVRQREAASKRQRRAADSTLREREATSKRQRRAADPELRQREAASVRERRAAEPEVRDREVQRKRTKRAAEPDLRQREAALVRERRAAEPEVRDREVQRKRTKRAAELDLREREAACKRQQREAAPDAARDRERAAKAAARAKQHAQPDARFGHSCKVCDRLWFDNNLTRIGNIQNATATTIRPTTSTRTCASKSCCTCRFAARPWTCSTTAEDVIEIQQGEAIVPDAGLGSQGSIDSGAMTAVEVKAEPPDFDALEEPGSPVGSVKSESDYYEEVQEPGSTMPAVKIEPPDYKNEDSIHLMDTELPDSEEIQQPDSTAVAIKTEPQDPVEDNAVVSVETGLGAAALQGVQEHLVPVNSTGLGTLMIQQQQTPANIIYFHKVEQYGVAAQPTMSTQPVMAVQSAVTMQPVEPEQTVLVPTQAVVMPLHQESPMEKIARLEAELENLQQALVVLEKQKSDALQQAQKVMSGLSDYLEEDQVRCLEKENAQGILWSDKTLEKALKIWLSCGSRGYNVVKEVGQPLPSERALQRHIQNRKFAPEKLNTIMDSIGV